LANPIRAQPLSRNIKWEKIGGGFQNANVNLLFEVEPSRSPDGQKMVISSARNRHPMIYVVDMNTYVAKQLTFAGIYNASPAWSPKGDKIHVRGSALGGRQFRPVPYRSRWQQPPAGNSRRPPGPQSE
jgi:hypothetical protein